MVAAVPIWAPIVALASYSPALSSSSLVATALVASAAVAQVSAKGEQHERVVVLLSELGSRRGEGLGPRRKDIDFDNQTITICTAFGNSL